MTRGDSAMTDKKQKNMTKKIKILLTGGGTGGHIIPLIVIAKSIKEQYQVKGFTGEVEFMFIGDKGNLSKDVFEKEDIKVKHIFTAKIRRYFSWRNFLGFFTFPLGIIQSFWYLFWFMPDAIFSKGGYGSVPAVMVGWIYRIPILIHESDAAPGLANRLTAKLAARVAVSFYNTLQYFPKQKTILTGNPIRSEIDKGIKDQAKSKFGLRESLPVIFVLGGSQGAKSINSVLFSVLTSILPEAYVLHQCGNANKNDCQKQLENLNLDSSLRSRYHLFGFIGDDLKDIYAVADLVVTRAGANTLTEIAACRKPSIIIPLSGSAGNHQEQNAFLFVEKGAAILVEEENLQVNLFTDLLLNTIKNKEKLEKLAHNAGEMFITNTEIIIADGVIELAK